MAVSRDKLKNRKILKAISYYEGNPDAQFKSRAEYIEYFETRKIKTIKILHYSYTFIHFGELAIARCKLQPDTKHLFRILTQNI
ncbi:hypothetical protein HDF26_000994 [Pedobacter cryoconitis]|uniref:hypothetical protein n=1 Tax=Pedobacter cryoconitis TaxID=188932 RepID=UPI001617CD47|nr:hypothetical protein [Pedobacter cryoconitis]MBB6270567.1 hypothetical protein [Pedobacter cryoconitis]